MVYQNCCKMNFLLKAIYDIPKCFGNESPFLTENEI